MNQAIDVRNVQTSISSFLVVLGVIGIVACPSAANSLRDLKRERTQLVDTLFADYGRFENASGGIETGGGSSPSVVEGMIGEFSRALFESSCETVGGGDRLVLASDATKRYFAQLAVLKRCERLYDLNAKIAELEKQSENSVNGSK